jgi:hypothetical protein
MEINKEVVQSWIKIIYTNSIDIPSGGFIKWQQRNGSMSQHRW